MPKTKIPTLGAVAEAQAEEEKTKKGKGLIARGLAMLGIASGAEDAKTSKHTVTTKRVEMMEDDEEADAEDTGADAEEETSETDVPEKSEAESEDTGADAESAEAGAVAASDDANDRALASAVAKALNSPSVHQAFLAALPTKHRELGALYSPQRLASAARKATGKSTSFAAMGALAELNQRSKGNAEAMLAKQAKLEQRVARVEGARRSDRVNAIVSVAKERGVPGATSREGREMLRAYGMQHGTKSLSAFVASQGPGLRTREMLPKTNTEGAVLGAPDGEEQKAMMERAMSGLSPKEREEFAAIAGEKLRASNGAAPAEA